MVGMDYHNSYGVIERVGDAIEDSIKYRNSKILEYEEFARAVGAVKRLLSELILNDEENIG